MAEAVVYLSNAGHAQRYAEMFAAETGLPCYEAGEAQRHLIRGAEIIYFGWMMAGNVKGYEKAGQRYDVRALAGVGARAAGGKVESEIRERHHTGAIPVFYLRGGVDLDKLGPVYRKMFALGSNMLAKAAAKDDATPEAIAAAQEFELNKDYVCEQNLRQMLAWYREQ